MMHIIKIGGNELDKPQFLTRLALTVAEMADLPIIVNGGGKMIAKLQTALGLKKVKVDGLRVSDAGTVQAAEMVLSGHSNKLIVKALVNAGIPALGLSGVDNGLLRCVKKQHPTADLGFVGEIEEVNAGILHLLLDNDILPVISPISLGRDGHSYNVNADDAATAIAAALNAKRLDFVSNVPGILLDDGVISVLSLQESEGLIDAGIITDGMVPKVRAAIKAVAQGVSKARIVNIEGVGGNAGTVFYENAAKIGRRQLTRIG